jgi:hypothetical protein
MSQLRPRHSTDIHWLMVNPSPLHIVFDTDEGPPRVTVFNGLGGEEIALHAIEDLNKAMLTASLILTSAYIRHVEGEEVGEEEEGEDEG